MKIYTNSLIIIFSNVLAYMLSEVVFFWEIASNNIEKLAIDKSTVLIQLAQQSPQLINTLNNYLNSTEYQVVKKQALLDSNNRYDYNLALILHWMMPPFIFIICLLILSILIELIWIKKFDKTDALIQSTVFLCFLTEVIFYYTVIYRSELISDMEVIQLLLNNTNLNINEYIYGYIE